MTLIIAGYDKQSDSDKETTFFISDSAITREYYERGKVVRTKTLLTDYRKLYTKHVTIHFPRFNQSGMFERFYHMSTIGKVVIAFAGGKDTAHHVLNQIEIGLANIKVSYEMDGKVQLVPMDTMTLLEIKTPYERCWDVENLNSDNIGETLSHELLAGIIKVSIEKALISAKEHKLDELDFRELKCEFIASVYCNVLKKHFLYKFLVDKVLLEGLYTLTVSMTLIPESALAYIGIPEFGKQLDSIYNEFLRSPERIKNEPKQVEYSFLKYDLGDEYHSSYQYLLPHFSEVVKSCKTHNNPLIDFPVHSMTMDNTIVNFYNHRVQFPER